jgi:hypothetical protein
VNLTIKLQVAPTESHPELSRLVLVNGLGEMVKELA